MKFFSTLSIRNKLLIVILPIILLSFIILGLIATYKVRAALNDETVRQLEGTVSSLSDMVVIANESTIRDADSKMSNLLQEFQGTFSLDAGATVRVGEQDAPVLKFNGNTINMNFAKVDQFTRQNDHSVATVFVRKGDDFIRVSTSLKKEDGSRAIGTFLGSAHPAFALLMKGDMFHGKAKLFGHYYMTKYVPIRGADRTVIGALFVGTNIDNVIAKLEKTIATVKVGKTGYAFVMDNGATKTRGDFIIHPDKKNLGKNAAEFKDVNGKPFIREMLEAQTGRIDYWWKNEGESTEREKFAIFATTPVWGWLIACSGYTSEIYAAARSIQMYILLASVICAWILAALIAMTVRKLLMPLKETADVLEKIANGDLTMQLSAAGDDEIGMMQRACQQMVARLNDILHRTASNAGQLAAAANQLQATAEHMATGSEELVSQTGSVATASEEMSVTSTEIARSCSTAANASDRSSESACTGARVVQETIAGMNSLAGQVRDTSKTIEALGSRSEQIGNIVGTIEDIADQTNLLALNAAIEAARAGEQGRGFAVVADEVRALAERTTKATKEIGEMIREIQNETRKAVHAMESGVSEAEKGAESAVKSGEALDNIINRINEVAVQVSQIATAAEQQTATTSEVATNIQQITEVVQESARGAQESATAARQLASLASDLQDIVGQFKLTA